MINSKKRPKYIMSHESILPISFHDTDAMGVVWHGNYYKFFEIAREEMFEALDFDYKKINELNYVFPITECSCIYRKPLLVTDKRCRVVCYITCTEGKLEIYYEIYAISCDTLCATGKTQQVVVNSKTRDLLFELPHNLLESIENYAKTHE